MKVRDVMKQKVYGIDVTDTLHHAFSKMKEKKIKHLPVFENDELVGILSDRDLIGRATRENGTYMFPRITVERAMTKPVITCAPDTKLYDALELMLTNDIHCLPVKENNKILGIMTVKDLLQVLDSKESL